MSLNLFELSLLQKMHDAVQCAFLDRLAVILSVPGNAGMIFIALAVLLLCFKKTRLCGAVMATALIFDVVLVNGGLKPLIARTRPYELGVALKLLIAHPNDHSFPSGHTAAAFAAAAAASVGPKKLHTALLVYAGLMGLSRMYLMMHYPTDVLGGALCGALCGLAAVELWKRLSKTKGVEC